jgi:hypothetical protein
LYSADGDYRTFKLHTTSSISGKIYNLSSSTDAYTYPNYMNLISSSIDSTDLFQVTKTAANTLKVIQKKKTAYGNTKIVSSFGSKITINNFDSGRGHPNHGLVIKLSDSAESGEEKASYYTKRFFARGTEYFFKRPCIEARSENIVSDDRYHQIYKSSSLLPAEENLNKIYLYNIYQGEYVDIPDTGSLIQVHFTTASFPDEHISMDQGSVLTASHETKGVYSVQFSYSGSINKVYDFWSIKNLNGSQGPHLSPTSSGPSIAFKEYKPQHLLDNPSKYIFKIVNLKSRYSSEEKTTLRVHTNKEDRDPNSYSKYTGNIKSDPVVDAFFKIIRVSDNLEVIPYTTGSSPQYSRMSYDVSGSFFDLDISILEPNYLYEISFLRKDGKNYIEQKERFKFRVEK